MCMRRNGIFAHPCDCHSSRRIHLYKSEKEQDGTGYRCNNNARIIFRCAYLVSVEWKLRYHFFGHCDSWHFNSLLIFWIDTFQIGFCNIDYADCNNNYIKRQNRVVVLKRQRSANSSSWQSLHWKQAYQAVKDYIRETI